MAKNDAPKPIAGAVAPNKEDLRNYFDAMGEPILKYIANRPLALVRQINGAVVYHRGKPLKPPPAVPSLLIRKREGSEGLRLYLRSKGELLALLKLDMVEIHCWNTTVDDIEHPDQIAFNFMPGNGVSWDFVIETAFELRGILQRDGLKPWAKASGGRELHVLAPLTERTRNHDEVRSYGKELMEKLAALEPKRYTLSKTADRDGRIYLDYERNGWNHTLLATYSPRAVYPCLVSAPMSWKQVKAGVRSDAFPMQSYLPETSPRKST